MNAKTTMNAKNTARGIVCALLAVGAAPVPAFADECGNWDFEPIMHSDYALVGADQALEIAVAALPISGWDEVASLNRSFFLDCTYRVETHANSGRWRVVWIDGRSGDVQGIH